MLRRPAAVVLAVALAFAIASPLAPSLAAATTASGDTQFSAGVVATPQSVDTGAVHRSSNGTPADGLAPHVAITAVRTSGDPGLAYRITITSLDDVDGLWVSTADASMHGTAGVRHSSTPAQVTWDGTSETVRVTVVPETATADESLAVRGDGWAFGPVPPVLVAYRPVGGEIRQIHPFEATADPSVIVDSAGGLVGEKYALVGRSSVRSVAVDHGRVTLVVPDGVHLARSEDAILATYEDAAAAFDDGAGAGDDVVFVLPPDVRSGGATFVHRGETWVTADSPVRTANTVWLHEYVHTRQRFDLGPRMRWFREASAEYFGARLARETGLVSPVEYDAYLLGRQHSSSVLTRPATWTTDAPYQRGTVVLAALDDEIRARTDGQRSLEDVFSRLNRHEGTVTYPVFVATVSDVAGTDMGPWLDRTVAGRASVGGPAAVSWLFEAVSHLAAVARTIPRELGVLVGVGAALAVHSRS